MKLRAAVAAVVVTVGGVTATSQAAVVVRPEVATFPTAGCVEAANSYRIARGLRPLQADSRLQLAAQRHATYQATIRRMTHTGSGRTSPGQRMRAAGYRWSAWTENVAYGYNSCAEVMRAWMKSSGHRANILNRRMVHVGFGASTGSNGLVYWTMDEARPG